MKVVLDANRLFSALLRDGRTRRELFTTEATLHAPAFLRTEFDKHRAMLSARSGLDAASFDALVDAIFGQVEWVDDETIEPFVPAAQRALAGTDPDDVAYLAAALAIRADAIWSHDPDFDVQRRVRRIASLGDLVAP